MNTAILLSMGCAALAALAALPGPRGPRPLLRVREVSARRRAARRGSRPSPGWLTRHPWPAAAVAGVFAGVGVGGQLGVVAGFAVFLLGGVRLRRAASDAVDAAHRQAAADLPLAADLLAASMTAGARPDTAAEIVGRAVGGPVGEELRRVSSALRLGVDPAEAWLSLPAPLVPLGRAFARAAQTGAALADLLAGVAAQARRTQLGAAEIAARRVGVAVAAPLGLCFLPAFVLLAVVPVVAGIVRSLDVVS